MVTRMEAAEKVDLELAEIRAVERVRDVGAERLEIEILGTTTDLLVDREGDANRCAWAVRRAGEVRHGSHDLGDPGLVVSAEECRPVARHHVVADAGRQRRQSRRIENLARVAG